MILNETNYLIENHISIKEYQKVLEYVGNSKYAKLNLPNSITKQELRNLQKLTKKFKDADLIKVVKGELRLNPYFYLQPNLETSVIRKLQKEWDTPEDTQYVGDKFITDPTDGVVYKVWLDNSKVKFREAAAADYK